MEESVIKAQNGYSLCLNKWAIDQEIQGELGLLCIVSGLSASQPCFASNEYLSEIFGVRPETISRKLTKLKNKGLIDIEYKRRGCEVKERLIKVPDLERLTKKSTDDCVFNQSTIDENVKENNTSMNITSINKKENTKRKVSSDVINPEEIVDEFLNEKFCNQRDIVLWKEQIMRWLSYKKEEHREKYKTKRTLRDFMNLLFRYSQNGYETARKIIDQAIANRYKGIYEPKKNKEFKRYE